MTARPTSPLTATQLVDEYFIENRNRLLEIAAFLDRIDRADPAVAANDFRMRVFAEAIAALTAAAPERLAHIQMLLSDPDATPLEALDRKGAVGAYDPSLRESRS
ncbi:MAG TPA: hypothetical protein VG538_15310 [Vicinamibacterales bacterium]|jgi:hypothetical protein|nr:hypothetical protein [Vicinamibacterales bacterium]